MAIEAEREVAIMPDEVSVSVVTLAELHLGVLLAKDATTRAVRLWTLSRVERDFEAIPIDPDVARVFGSIVAEARKAGRRPQVNDVWIAATAVRHRLVLFSRDTDFETIPQVRFQRV